MRKIVLLFVLLAVGTIAFSQEITVRFTGLLNNSEYCRLDSVKVTNLTHDWMENVEYPDTIIVLGGTVNANLNIATTSGLGQNVPNPFNCETRIELSVSQHEDVRIQLFDASGKLCANYHSSLDAGIHNYDISAAMPQTYMLNAMVGSRSYSIRMVNVGSGCGNSIRYAGISGEIISKLTSTNEFQIGDNMRYVGYATIDGQIITSEIVELMQTENQDVILNFAHYSQPSVETINASDITSSTATLSGNVISDGGSIVIVRGFLYGTNENELTEDVQCGNGIGNFTTSITNLVSNTTYYFKAYAINTIGTSYGETLSFATLEGTEGTLNGRDWVDLGLPSGTRWATCNIGATTPEDYGYYYAWGETTTKNVYNESTYTYADSPVILPASADAATANWGEGWRMPTYDELNELTNNCTITWTTQNGIYGRLFTGSNGNSIFLPCAGRRYDGLYYNVGDAGEYWSSSLSNRTDFAWYL